MEVVWAALAPPGAIAVFFLLLRLAPPSRRHRHDWGPWEVDHEVTVYATGTRKETSYPIRHETWQRRTCGTCQLTEWEKSISG